MAANDLGIATHVELIVRAASVEDRHHGLALPLAAEDIDALVGDELLLRALRDGLAALTPMEHAAQPGEHPLLGLIAARGREAVVGVAREAAREVATHIAVRHLLGAVEEHLRAIVELRDAVHRQQQGERLLESRGVASLAQEAVGVVVFDEGEHARRIGVEIVVAEDVVDAVEALPPVVGLLVAGQREAVEEGEVHDRLEIAILRAEARVLLPGRGIGRLRHPGLAHAIEVGILRVDGLHPGRHGLAVGVGIGVHADAVDGGRLDPPDTVLDEVAHDVGVALVEVGHGGDKPSVGSLLAVDVGGVGVEDGRELIAGLEAIAGMVEPVAGRAVLLPGMVTAAMVEDHVHDDLQSALVAGADQGAIVGIGAKARIDAVVVGRGIAVVGTRLLLERGGIVFEDGREPQSRDAQVGEVVEVAGDARKVASVAQRGLRAVAEAVAHALDDIIARVAIGKAVGHEEIEHVSLRKALVVLGSLGAGVEHVALRQLAAVELKLEAHLARLSALEIHIDEQIVGRVEAHEGVDTRMGVVGRDLGVAYALAIDHELERGVFHPHIPVGGVDAGDLHLRADGEEREEEKEEGDGSFHKFLRDKNK